MYYFVGFMLVEALCSRRPKRRPIHPVLGPPVRPRSKKCGRRLLWRDQIRVLAGCRTRRPLGRGTALLCPMSARSRRLEAVFGLGLDRVALYHQIRPCNLLIRKALCANSSVNPRSFVTNTFEAT